MRRKREKNKKVFEVIKAKKFSKLMTVTKTSIQVAQRTPSRKNTKKSTLRNIISNCPKFNVRRIFLKK